MTAEARAFDDLPSAPVTGHVYTTSYLYNLAGSISRITDPFGYQVDYTFDAINQLATVTAPGYNSHNDTISDFSYRAYGAVKSKTFSWNGHSSTVDYTQDARQQTASFGITDPNVGTQGATYERDPDGRVSFAEDLTDESFDRSYEYDQRGRVNLAKSGSQASGGTTVVGPYSQSYGYDVWNNITSRTGKHWSHNVSAASFSFTNSRNTAATYDAEGHATAENGINYVYNAAGQQIQTYKTGSGAFSQVRAFDGDGVAVRMGSSSYQFSVPATALGGGTVAALDSSGAKTMGYIFVNGKKEGQVYPASSTVMWEQHSPIGSGKFDILYGSVPQRTEEYDPLGSNVGIEDPYATGGGGWDASNPSYGNAANFGGNCYYEGSPMNCGGLIKFVLHNPTLMVWYWVHAKYQWSNEKISNTENNSDESVLKSTELGEISTEKITLDEGLVAGVVTVAAGPSNATRATTVSEMRLDVWKYGEQAVERPLTNAERQNAEAAFTNFVGDGCRKYVAALLDRLKLLTGKANHNTTNIVALFQTVLLSGFFGFSRGLYAGFGKGKWRAAASTAKGSPFEIEFNTRTFNLAATSALNGQTIVHELIHLMGYGHSQMAEAARDVSSAFGFGGIPDLPERGNYPAGQYGDAAFDDDMSTYFGDRLWEGCQQNGQRR